MFEMQSKSGKNYSISDELYDAVFGDNWNPSDFEFVDDDQQILMVTDEAGNALEAMSAIYDEIIELCPDSEKLRDIAEANGYPDWWAASWDEIGCREFDSLLEAVRSEMG